MKVCNVCLGSPEYSGNPQIVDDQGDKTYLFAPTWKDSQIDLCKKCLDNFQNGRWDKLAEDAHDVLMLRLGVKEGPLAN